MKRIFAVLLALGLLCTTAFAAVDPCPNTTEFPIVDEPITITCMNWAYSYTRGEFSEQMFWKELEKMTNIHIEFETYYSDIEEKFSLALAANVLPDFFYKINTSKTNVWKYAQDEVFVPVSDYLDVMPSFSYQLDNMAGLRKAIAQSDGKIYGLPYIVSCDAACTMPIFVNGTWLKELGYDEMPDNLEGLKKILIEVRDSDMNGNGEADEIPLAATYVGTIYNMFKGSFGLATRGTTVSNIDADENGNLRFYAAADGWRDELRFLNELYTEKLLYQEIFTSDIPVITALGEENRLFLAPVNIPDYFGETHRAEFIGVEKPFAGEYNLYSIASAPCGGNQNTFVSTDNKYPAETFAMLDWFYSDEGVRTYFMGFEDITWNYDEEGNVVYSDYVLHNPDGLNTEEVLGSYVPWAGGRNPSMAENRYFGNMYNGVARKTAEALAKFGPEEVWITGMPYSDEDATRLATLKTDIDNFVSEQAAKFVTGELNLDTDWDSYLSTLNAIGLEELMAIYQRGLDAYNSVG